MSIVVTCSCGSKFAARPDLAGKTLACPSCKNQLQVPQPPPVVASCGCGQRFSAPANMAGKQVACPSCKRPLTVSNQPVSAQPTASAANLTALDLGEGQSNASASNFVAQSPRPAPPPPARGPSLGTIIGGIFGFIGAVVLVGCVATMYLGFFAIGGVPDVDLEQLGERYSDKRGVVKADEGEEFLLYQDLVAALTYSRPKPGTIPPGWSTQSIGENSNASFAVPQNASEYNSQGDSIKRFSSADRTGFYEVGFSNQQSSDPLTQLALTRAEELKRKIDYSYEKRLEYQGFAAWECEFESDSGGSIRLARLRFISTPAGVFTLSRHGSPSNVRDDCDDFFATLDIKAAEATTNNDPAGGEFVAGGWKTQGLRGAGSVSFPASSSVTTREAANDLIYEAKTSSNRNSYTLLYKREKIVDTESYLSQARSDFMSGPAIRSKITNEKSDGFTFGGYPAWEYQLQMEAESGELVAFHVRWIATPHGKYALTRGGPPADVKIDGARFLDSLVIASPFE